MTTEVKEHTDETHAHTNGHVATTKVDEVKAKVAEVTADAADAEDKKLSPKNKIARGVAKDMKTTFVDLNLTPEENGIVRRAARAKDLKVNDLLRPYLQTAVKADWDNIVAIAESYEKADKAKPIVKKIESMTAEEAQEYVTKQEQVAANAMAKARQAAELAQKMIAAAKARIASAS